MKSTMGRKRKGLGPYGKTGRRKTQRREDREGGTRWEGLGVKWEKSNVRSWWHRQKRVTHVTTLRGPVGAVAKVGHKARPSNNVEPCL